MVPIGWEIVFTWSEMLVATDFILATLGSHGRKGLDKGEGKGLRAARLLCEEVSIGGDAPFQHRGEGTRTHDSESLARGLPPFVCLDSLCDNGSGTRRIIGAARVKGHLRRGEEHLGTAYI